MFNLILGVILGAGVSILEKAADPPHFGISRERIKEIEAECFEECFSEAFRSRIEGNRV